VEQERGLRKDDRDLRDPARARALKAKRRIKRPGKGPIGLRPAPALHNPVETARRLLGDSGRLGQMHAAGAPLTIEHGVLSGRHFLLGRSLVIAISHGLDRGLGLRQVGTAAADTTHLCGLRRDDCESHCSDCGCSDYCFDHETSPFQSISRGSVIAALREAIDR